MSSKYPGDGASHPQFMTLKKVPSLKKAMVPKTQSVSDIKISKQAPPDVAESGNAARTWDFRLILSRC
jgi:hypothetical protein